MMQLIGWRHIFSLTVLVGMNLVMPAVNQADEIPLPRTDTFSEAGVDKPRSAATSELLNILKEQDLRLAEQEKLIASQQEDINEQRTLLRTIQAQLNQQASDQEAGGQQIVANQPLQVENLDDLLANQPESTSFDDDFVGSIPIPNTDAAVKIGGFVKMNMVGTLDPLGSDDRFITGLIPVENVDSETEHGEVKVTANQSRLGFELRDMTPYGTLRAYIEGDFAGVGDTYRLRHAYGQFRQILAGKTWSTMVDNRATPEDIDFEGINGRIQVRQAQVRYFPTFGRGLDLLIGLEDPAPDVTGGHGISRYPDVVASVRRNWGDRWHVKTSLLLRQIQAEWDVDRSVSDKELGWGISASGKIGVEFWSDRDNVLFQFNYGDGIGRYINDLGTVGGQDGVFNPETGELNTLNVFSGYISYQHWWQASWRSTFIYSWVDVENLDFQKGSAYAGTDRSTINLLWSPVPRIDVGGELIWGRRENNDGNSGTARQIQFGAKYRY